MRSVLCCVSAEREGNFQRDGKGESADFVGRKGDRFACTVVYRELRERGDTRHARRVEKLGFYEAEETAIGATIVKTEYEKYLAEKTRDIVISSCCHSVNLLIQKYFPKELTYLADVLSPMQAHAKDIKRRNPGAKVVFIGPCVAKKDEAAYYEGIVDAVLTYEDLAKWMKEENVEIVSDMDDTAESRARFSLRRAVF